MSKEKLPKAEPVLCAICGQPSAIFTTLDGVLTVPVRLAKTMVLFANAETGESGYLHEDPCFKVYKEQNP